MLRLEMTCAAAVLLAASSAALSAVVYVSKSGSDAYTGSSWASAKKTIRAALDAAAYGDQVWVAAGSYWENITLKDGVALYGGFASVGGAWGTRNWSANVTEINGGQSNTAVKSAYGAGSGTCIDGFLIQNGRADVGAGIYCYRSSPVISNNRIKWNYTAGYNSYGGGICCEYASPIITGNIIELNIATYGGGVYCSAYSQPVISGNTFTGNTGTYGGGIYCADYASPTISNNTISGNGHGIYCDAGSSPSISSNTISNNSGTQGAGVFCAYSSPSIILNTIKSNVATDSGGGIYCDNSSPSITGNLITANRAVTGAGVAVKFDSSPIVTSNTIASNIGSGTSGGGLAWYGASATVANNIIYANSSGVCKDTYSYGTPISRTNCSYGNGLGNWLGISSGSGDISANPAFGADYRLGALSPCINAGSNLAGLLATDIDGQARIWAGTVDMGADEFRASVTGLADVKATQSGSWVETGGMRVTAAFSGFFYVESDDRSSGVRVKLPGHAFAEGARVSVTGKIALGDEGERYIEAAEAVVSPD